MAKKPAPKKTVETLKLGDAKRKNIPTAEYQSVLQKSEHRVRRLQLAHALAAFQAAEQLVADAMIEPSTEQCLRLAAAGRVSAWDAEFVFVAEARGLPLVTADRRLARAFPGRVVPLDDLIAGL